MILSYTVHLLFVRRSYLLPRKWKRKRHRIIAPRKPIEKRKDREKAERFIVGFERSTKKGERKRNETQKMKTNRERTYFVICSFLCIVTLFS